MNLEVVPNQVLIVLMVAGFMLLLMLMAHVGFYNLFDIVLERLIGV